MDTTQLDRLIISNLEDLDLAARRIEQIETRIWQEIGDLASRWVKKRPTWVGDFDKEDVWVAPRAWTSGDYTARFYLWWGEDDTGGGLPGEPWFHLSRLVGVAGGRLSLWFEQKGVGGKAWKATARATGSAMSERGFQLSDRGNFYTDCTPSSALVADGLDSGDLTEALDPLGQALERAASAAPELGKMMKKAWMG